MRCPNKICKCEWLGKGVWAIHLLTTTPMASSHEVRIGPLAFFIIVQSTQFTHVRVLFFNADQRHLRSKASILPKTLFELSQTTIKYHREDTTPYSQWGFYHLKINAWNSKFEVFPWPCPQGINPHCASPNEGQKECPINLDMSPLETYFHLNLVTQPGCVPQRHQYAVFLWPMLEDNLDGLLCEDQKVL